jgi:hypothetical protein
VTTKEAPYHLIDELPDEELPEASECCRPSP